MTDEPAACQAGEVLRAIGKVQVPAPRVLEKARELLWSAVAGEMLGMDDAGGQPTATRGSTGRAERTPQRRQTDRPHDERKMSMGGGDLEG
jgi:hypothetical protein